MGQDGMTEEARRAADRERIQAERTERKLRRARRNAVSVAHATARAQGFEARGRLPWPARRDQDPMAQLPDREIAAQRDRALVDGNVDDFRVRRELLQLRRHLRRAGRAYGAVQRLGFLLTRNQHAIAGLRFLVEHGVALGSSDLLDLVKAIEEAAGRLERNRARVLAARARKRAALDGPRPPETKAERALFDVADLVLNESDLAALAERLAEVPNADVQALANHYRRLHAEVGDLARKVFGAPVERKAQS